MTPIALTRAARGKRAAGHRSVVRRTAAPSAPRRVSGPVRTTPRTPPAPRRSPAGKTRRLGRTAPPLRPVAKTARPTLGARAVAFIRALPDHHLLDRVVRGRAWIPILGILLAGIVAMQVEVLKLGAGIGRAIERGTQLQSRNELLRARVASLADDQRIERLAAGMGMMMPAPTAIHFLSLKPSGYVQRAANGIHQPDPTGFAASLPAPDPSTQGAATTGTASTTDASTATGATGASSAVPATTSAATAATSGAAATSTSTGG
jgi:hypothetical protein